MCIFDLHTSKARYELELKVILLLLWRVNVKTICGFINIKKGKSITVPYTTQENSGKSTSVSLHDSKKLAVKSTTGSLHDSRKMEEKFTTFT